MRLLSALVPLATSRYRAVEIFDGDSISSVKQLREVFDERFSKPRESHPDRFSWDPWHVTRRAEDAPAAAYFPEELFEQFCEELAEFGQKHLGCDAFTPPWLACYTDGHEMAWHSDASHGPFLCGNQQSVGAQFFTKPFLGDGAAVLAPSSGEEPASPRHRAGVASMACRSTRRFSTIAP